MPSELQLQTKADKLQHKERQLVKDIEHINYLEHLGTVARWNEVKEDSLYLKRDMKGMKAQCKVDAHYKKLDKMESRQARLRDYLAEQQQRWENELEELDLVIVKDD